MSQFLSDGSEYNAERVSDIDFTSAVRLPQEGSVCEVYKTRWQRRTVFVKRLKEKYRNSPLHLDALEKEFEIGVTLNHPSLPSYLAFDRDYIVMEYVDGVTLASMLKEDDLWLGNGENQLSLLNRLVETVDYLHRHKVVHCDIKPDNIILTSNGYNPVLVDFDKCYTDSFNDTSGHPDKFGLPSDNPGRTQMDFRGVANVAESIVAKFPTSASRKIKRFISSARKDDASPNALQESLKGKRKTGVFSLSFLVLGMIVLIALALGSILFFKDREKSIGVDSRVQPSPLTIKDSVPPSQSSSLPLASSSPSEKQELGPASKQEISVKTQEQLHEEARARAAVLDKLIAPRFEALNARLDRLILLKSSDISGQQLLDSIRAYGELEEECYQEVWAIINEIFSPISEREGYRLLSYSKVFTGYNRRSVHELAEIGRIIREKMDR